MTVEEFKQMEQWRRQFKRLENSLFKIRQKLVKQEGFLFVKWHAYDQKELYDGQEFATLRSASEMIDYTLENWITQNNISEALLTNYNILRDNFENKVEQLESDIMGRHPTFWETISNGFRGLFKFIINKLPRIVLRYLSGGKSDILGYLE